MQKSTTENFQQTQKIGENFAKKILQQKLSNHAVVLGLRGDLGSGKTTFLQGFAKGLGVTEKINSPTFVILKRFKIKDLRFKNFYHIDLYRLEGTKDLEFFNFKEIISNPENIIAIEWPEKLGELLPKKSISMHFNHLEENKREIIIDNF